MQNAIDTTDFKTFLQLDDLKSNFTEELKRLEESEEPEVDISEDFPEEKPSNLNVDLEDLVDDDGIITFEDEEGWTEKETEEEPEEDTTDNEEDPEEEDEPEETPIPTESNDDPTEEVDDEILDVDYETVITLPDNRDMTVEELVNGYLSNQDLEGKKEELLNHAKAFEERVGSLQDILELSMLEADKVISDYEGFDWDELARENPELYVQNSRFLEKYKARKEELVSAQTRLKQEAQAKEAQMFQEKCVECVNVLKKEIPNWNQELYENLMNYAIELGAVKEEIEKENRPSIFLALNKAYQFDKGKQTIMAKIRRPGSPKKVLKNSGGKQNISQSVDQAKLVKAFSEGRIDRATAFQHLID